MGKPYNPYNNCSCKECCSDHSDYDAHHGYAHYDKCELEKIALKQLVENCYEYRKLDGSGNNRVNTDYGLAEQPFIRKAAADYNDDDACPVNDLGGDRGNPRAISNEVFAQPESIPNSRCISNMFWLWGQFVDHDITLTHTTDEMADIPVPDTDPDDPLKPGPIMFSRSAHVDSDENCRNQVNSLTPFLDGSNVYGTTTERNTYMREFCGGRLKVVCGNYPPYNDSTIDNEGGSAGPNFVCGDVRANEHVALACMHTLFVREHNHWACKIAEACPHFCDEEIYQRAKLMVEAEIEAITFNEFLPLLLGCDLPCYSYDCTTNPQLTNEFSAAAYRFGHSMLPSQLTKKHKLRDLFFSSHYLSNGMYDLGNVFTEFACRVAEELDHKVVDDIRNFLFGEPGQGGLDLAALNIQRGRDHGLPKVNDLLTACNMSTISDFTDITSDTDLQAKLANLYDSATDIDLWVFGLIQQRQGKSLVGPLFNALIKDSFMRLRDGDRLWYENRLTECQIQLANCTKLSDIIRRNSDCVEVQDDVFIVEKKPCCYKHSSHKTHDYCECDKCDHHDEQYDHHSYTHESKCCDKYQVHDATYGSKCHKCGYFPCKCKYLKHYEPCEKKCCKPDPCHKPDPCKKKCEKKCEKKCKKPKKCHKPKKCDPYKCKPVRKPEHPKHKECHKCGFAYERCKCKARANVCKVCHNYGYKCVCVNNKSHICNKCGEPYGVNEYGDQVHDCCYDDHGHGYHDHHGHHPGHGDHHYDDCYDSYRLKHSHRSRAVIE